MNCKAETLYLYFRYGYSEGATPRVYKDKDELEKDMARLVADLENDGDESSDAVVLVVKSLGIYKAVMVQKPIYELKPVENN